MTELEALNEAANKHYISKRGSCCVRNHMISEPYGNRMLDRNTDENEWVIDKNIPIFKGADRKYIDNLVFVGE